MAMRLNHVNLAVTDVQETRAFFEKYFGMRPANPKMGGDVIAVLFDDDGLVLTLSNPERATEVSYPASFHIGFIQPSPERVDEINRRLKADGFDVPPPSRQHGSWTFYFKAPGGFTIEVLG